MLERSSIDNHLTFDVSLIQLTFHTIVFTLCMQRVFNPNVTLFQFNSTEGLHLVLFIIILVCFSIHSLIHYYCIVWVGIEGGKVRRNVPCVGMSVRM